jgi:hypothetical protein
LGVVGIFGQIDEELAAERARGDLQAFEADRGRSETVAAHAGDGDARVLQTAQEIEHARVVEMHANQDERDAVLGERGARFLQIAHDDKLMPGEDVGEPTVAVGRVREQDTGGHVGKELWVHSWYAPLARPLLHHR